MLDNFKEIKKPEELLEFMSKNFHYGFVKRSDGKILNDFRSNEWKEFWIDEYFLQKPEELMKNKYGVCWDFVEFEREWFKNNGYELKTFYMAVLKKEGSKLPTHTFLAYHFNNKWYWFEFSWYDRRGIIEFESINDLLVFVNKAHIDSIKNKGATLEDIQSHKIYVYENTNFGSSPIEFVTQIIKNSNKEITF